MGTITLSWEPNNYSNLNQSDLRKTENPPLSEYSHCASVRNITGILKTHSLWYLPFSELLFLSVSCKTSSAKILAQRKYPSRWCNPLQVRVLNWKLVLLAGGVTTAEHIVKCQPDFFLALFILHSSFSVYDNFRNKLKTICRKLGSHCFFQMCNVKSKDNCMPSNSVSNCKFIWKHKDSCVWVDLICYLYLSGPLDTSEHVIVQNPQQHKGRQHIRKPTHLVEKWQRHIWGRNFHFYFHTTFCDEHN